MVFQGVHGTEDPRTVGLDHLVELLTRLKSFGFQNASAGLWDEQSARASHHTPSDILTAHYNPFPDLLQSLEESKSCLAILDEVRGHLRRRIRHLRKACTPFILETGVKTLPDDVISRIFETGHHMSKGWAFVKSVSRVSHRFRQVSLQTPLLWTRLFETYMHADGQLQTFLSRSGAMDLEVSINTYYEREETILSYLEILRPYVHRWSHLCVFSPRDVIGQVGLTKFPRLQYLYDGWDTNLNLSTWSAPLLSRHSQDLTNAGKYTFLPQLTTLEIFHMNSAMDVASLMQALYSMVNLKNLSLTFDACGDLMTDHPLADLGMLDDHSVAIESLRIEFANQTPYKVIGRLYDSLSFLSPSSVDITMEKLFNDEKYPLDRFFFRNKDHIFPHGSTIRIHVSGMRKTLDSQTSGGLLTELVEGCQIAHTIHLEVPDVSLIRLQSTNWSHFSSLRHLRFKGCDNLTEPEVDELVRNLMCGNAEGMGLQSLEIFSCEKISEEFLVELGDNVGPKLTWKMCDCE